MPSCKKASLHTWFMYGGNLAVQLPSKNIPPWTLVTAEDSEAHQLCSAPTFYVSVLQGSLSWQFSKDISSSIAAPYRCCD